MAVTVTFEKKHFLMAGVIISIPFMLIAISSLFAATTPFVGHSISELFIDDDLNMNGNKIIGSGNITIEGSENGIIFSDGSVQSSAAVTTGTEFVSCSWYKNGCPTGTVNEASPATNSKTKNAKEYYGSIAHSVTSCWDDCSFPKTALDCCKDNVNVNTVSTVGNGIGRSSCGGWWCSDCGQDCYGPDIVYHWCCPAP